MNFLTLIGRNLLRRPMRSLLTVVGIAVGIGAVVALNGIAWGFERAWSAVYEARGTDLVLARTSSQNAMPASFSSTIENELRSLPHVQDVHGTLVDILSVEDAPSIVVTGWQPGGSLLRHLRLERGRWPAPGAGREVMLGTIAAEMLGKSVGDEIQLETTTCRIVAVFSSPALAESGSLIVPLNTLQSLTDRPGKVNFFNLRLTPNTSPAAVEELREAIRVRFPGLRVFPAGEVAPNNISIRLAKAMSIATSLIALAVGAIGIMNTILMSVFERVHEIGVLLAIGWRRVRILRMILLESLALSLVGGIAGNALGVVAVRMLEASPWIRGKLQGEIDLPLLALAMSIALVLGALGGLYPAWIGSRMSPVAALHHE